MKPSVIAQLLSQLEKLVQVEFESGLEFWLARDLQVVLGYTNWQNFCKVIGHAMTACETSGHKVSDQFLEVTKLIALGKGEHTRPRVLSMAPPPRTWWKQDVRRSTRNLTLRDAPADFRRGRQKLQARALTLPSVLPPSATQSMVFTSAIRPRIILSTSVK